MKMTPRIIFSGLALVFVGTIVLVGTIALGGFSTGGNGQYGATVAAVGAYGSPPFPGGQPPPATSPLAVTPLAFPVVRETRAAAPPNYIANDIQLYEAHWQGMDTRLLDRELRRKLKYPRGLSGILIGEVTLNAAQAGFLAGDVIVAVANRRVGTLQEFQQRTRAVRRLSQVPIEVLRKIDRRDNGRFAMRRVTLVLRGEPDLGFAQVEAAPMILPGDGRPHPYRGACTMCHAVGVGFELTPDPDLITLPPPPLGHDSVVKGISPHRNRGPCEACHVIIR